MPKKKQIKKKKIAHKTIKKPAKQHKVKLNHVIVKNSQNPWVIIGCVAAVLIMILGLAGLLNDGQETSTKSALDPVKNVFSKLFGNSDAKSSYSGKTVEIIEYGDFQCPFCKRSADDTVAKIKKNFKDAVEIDYRHFPLSFHPNAQKAAEASECARDQNMFWDYHDKLFANQQSLDVENLKKYAKELGLDTSKFDSCLDNGDMASMVLEDFNEGRSLGVTGTPAFFIGEQMISGAQPYESFLPVICLQIPEHDACVNAPKSVEFKMYVVEDKRCETCDSSRIVSVTMQIFPGANVEYLDVTDKKGEELYDEIGILYLPLYVFEKKIEDDPGYSKISGAMVQKGNYYAILPQAAGSTFDPAAEICTNGVDDNADGVIDCDDEKCAASLECREELKQNIQLFIMSDCPYGKQAVEGLKGAIDNFGDELNYDVHYIASEEGDGFNSLHGQYEWEEDVRQLCAKQQSDDWFDYVYCRSVNGVKDVDWKACAEVAGLDVSEMEACFDTQGKDLLREDIKIANLLQVSSSPTWFANNRYRFSGLDSETVRQNFCIYNKGVKGCENTLSAESKVPQGSC